MRPWLFMLSFFFCSVARAEFDPTGPVVDWTGQITTEYRAGDDTCFELQKSAQTTNQTVPDKFKTCTYGYFDAAQFGAGKWLRVKGIRQPDNADKLPLVLGAQVRLTDPPLDQRYIDTYGPWDDPWGYGTWGGPWGGGLWMSPYPYQPFFW